MLSRLSVTEPPPAAAADPNPDPAADPEGVAPPFPLRALDVELGRLPLLLLPPPPPSRLLEDDEEEERGRAAA